MYRIIICLCLLSSSLFGQNQIELSHHIVQFDTIPSDSIKFLIKVNYSILNKKDAQALLNPINRPFAAKPITYKQQNISIEVRRFDFNNFLKNDYYKDFPYLIKDWNFDGYDDLAVFKDYAGGTRGKPIYSIYLYDVTKQKFVFHKKLSALSSYCEDGSLEIIPQKKQIKALMMLGSFDSESQTFIWKNNILTQVSEHIVNESSAWYQHEEYNDATTHSHTSSIALDRFTIHFNETKDGDCTYKIEFLLENEALKSLSGKCADLVEDLKNL